ncbi:MAG: hypothetical protein IKZ42_09120 [Clostridiales bacterium]|nr:hypothetical protein [Clostridiales bacterium]
MFCEQCGSFLQDGESFCTNCGAPAPAAKAAPAPAPAPAPGPVVQPIVQTPAQPVQPVYQQTSYQQSQPVQPIYQQPVYQQPAYQAVVITPFERPKPNGFATAGMVLGIVTCALYWTSVFNMIPGIMAIVFSIAGITKKDCGGKGKCIAGFITAGVGMLLGIIALISYIREYS